MSKAKKGVFYPINQHKLLTNKKIIYRSSWELSYMNSLDKNNKVEKWGSENVIIPYFNPIKNKKSRYYMDFQVKSTNKKIYLVEVKPYHETQHPLKDNVRQLITYATNKAKWNATVEYCNNRGWEFFIVTEKLCFRYGT